MTKTPFLIKTNHNSFEEYLKNLSSSSRWNYKNVLKKYNHLTYEYITPQLGKSLLQKFINIWSKQLIRGKISNMKALPIKNNSNFFVLKNNNEIIMLHLVEFESNYIYCHMPMYNKNIYDDLGKYSWFCLIKHCIEKTKFFGIDMGGVCGKNYQHNCKGDHCNPNFKYVIQNRDNLTKYEYKFVFLTKNEKNINMVLPYIINPCIFCKKQFIDHIQKNKCLNCNK